MTAIHGLNCHYGKLERLALHSLKKLAGQQDIVVCADELASLGLTAAQYVVSALSRLCVLYFNETSSICMVLVSSLETATFMTRSGMSVIDWNPDRADISAINYFAGKLADPNHFIALAKSICGTHMRSLVPCYKEMRVRNKPSMFSLYESMLRKLGTEIQDSHCSLIIEHVKKCMVNENGLFRANPVLDFILDDKGVVCPVFILHAFSEQDSSAAQLLRELYETLCLIHTDGKDLEHAYARFDLFRAHLRVPIVPEACQIHLPVGYRNPILTQWCRRLLFPDSMRLSEEDFLRMVETQTKDGKRKKVVAVTETKPQLGTYYHFGSPDHPWIDRGFVGVHAETAEHCLVLIQDKVKNDDFSEACKCLNKAASLLSATWGFKKFLLVINVIGLSDETRMQNSLEWPYILIQDKTEVNQFFSRNFGDLIWYARTSHQI